jgi:hypothetical protein
MQPGALFHPLQEDIIFLVWIYKHDLNGERPWVGMLPRVLYDRYSACS